MDDLDERQRQHELLHPKINRIHRYKTALFIIGICIIALFFTLAIFEDWISPYTYEEVTTWTGLFVDLEWYWPPVLDTS